MALRSLARAPGFTAVALLSLGVGIGAVTTIYNWTDRFLLHPLPMVPSVERLVQLETRGPGASTWATSYPTYRDWAERSQVFEAMAALDMEAVGVRFDQGVERAWALVTTDTYFDLLGVRASHGRTFHPGEEAAAAPVAVLGHDYWQRRFAGDPGVVGRTIAINGHGYEVVGVLPPRFGGSLVGLNFDLYLPITTYPILQPGVNLDARGSHSLGVLARLKPGRTRAQAQDDLDRVGRDLEVLYPDHATRAVVGLITDQGPPAVMKPVFLALFGVTGLVLLIACANVANLLLVRGIARRKEIGVRVALGSSRPRLVRQLLAESAILALSGGALGLLLAYAGRGALMALVPPSPFPIGMDFAFNWRVVIAALSLSAGTVALFGLWPALRASRPDLVGVLKDLPTGAADRSPARAVLVGAQVALAVVSLACAGLLLRAIERSRQVDTGFRDPAGLLLVDTELRAAGLGDTAGVAAVELALERIRQVPGVELAAASSFVPLSWTCCNSSIVQVDGYEPRRDENMSIVTAVVTPDYFESLRIGLLEGRTFAAADRETAAGVAIVNQAFVRRFWPGQPAIGRQFRQAGRDLTVVGVVRDGKVRDLTEAPIPVVYRVLGQSVVPALTFHVRAAAGNPKLLTEALRREVRAVHPDLPFVGARTMEENMLQATIGQQIGSRTLAAFGALALLLCAVGLYGVMAYSVSQRTREIGVRVALGAARGDITRLVVGQGLRITLGGLLAGGVMAIGAGRLMQGLLLGMKPGDPVTFGAVLLLLGIVAMAASVIPARRAARLDPVRSLRAD